MQYTMDLQDPKPQQSEEKEWENPVEPAHASDERDKEQMLRQYKEAKRRRENLTTEEEPKKKTK
jgi:hypothetical protein